MRADPRRIASAVLAVFRVGPGFRPGQILGLLLGPALLVGTALAPASLRGEQRRLLGLILMTITFWITRALPLPVTSILALALAVVLGVARASQVFGAFSSPTLFLLIGGFILTQAMIKYGLGRRIALSALKMRAIGASTHRIVVAFGALAAGLASVIDNGAVAAMLLPIAVGLIRELEGDLRQGARLPIDGSQLRFGTALMLVTAYGATVGGLLTPFANGSNLVGWYYIRRQFGVTIDAGTWIVLAAPIVVVLFALLAGAVLLLNRPEVHRLPRAADRLRAHYRELGRMSQGETNTAIAFGLAVIGWVLPPLVGFFAGYSSPEYISLLRRLNPAAVAVLSATMLFVLPLSRREGFTLRWRDVAQMDWSPVLLMGSGLALANLMAQTGLTRVLGQALAREIAGTGPAGVYLFSAALAMLVSELSSNLVSVSILVPIIPAMAAAGGGDPMTATLLATFGAVYGFMLPISTSANAVIYGSGQVSFLKMVRTGIVVDLTGVVVIVIGLQIMLQIVHVP